MILLDTRSIHATDTVSNRPYGCALSPKKMLLFFSCLTSILGCCSTVARAIQLNDKYMLTKLKSWCSNRVLMFDGSFGTYSWGIEQTDSVGCSQCQSCGCLPTNSLLVNRLVFFRIQNKTKYLGPYFFLICLPSLQAF